VLLKLSGAALTGEREFGLVPSVLRWIAAELKAVHELGVQLALVVGGGNIYRGAQGEAVGVDRVTGDYMGMLATIINSLALQSTLEKMGVPTCVQTAIAMPEIAEPFARPRALRHLEEGRLVIFAGGTGHPFFTTDTTAALRAAEIGAEALLMAKHKVDGIYSGDPNRDPSARKFDQIDYESFLKLRLQVMDAPAVSLCWDLDIPIIVFDFAVSGNIKRVVWGEPVGTIVRRKNHA